MSRSAIELHMDVPADVPEVACSQSNLEQVLLSLLTNAREATPHGGRIARAPAGGAALVDRILGQVHGEIAGRLQPDDLTLLTVSIESLIPHP